MSCILPSFAACCPVTECDDVITTSVPGPAGPQGEEGQASGELAGWFIRDTVALARLVPNDPVNRYLVMLGGGTKSDGFGGDFYWDNESIATDNYNEFGGSVIAPSGSSGPGRWHRI